MIITPPPSQHRYETIFQHVVLKSDFKPFPFLTHIKNLFFPNVA